MHYDPEYLLKRFTDHFKQKYKVECISALHHNKRKTNYHIHLIFAERQLLDKPVEKIATRNMFYDEMGKHRRTKKEILDEAGNIRKRCRVVRKGEMYERKLFTKKNELFKADGYLDEVKRVYTDLINTFAIKEEDKLHVFEKNGMYLATKKVGKNNPKAAEIEADNKVRMQWNQTVDRALISGGAKKDILDVKREKISEEVKHSIEIYGNRPFFLADIIILAIKALELLISKVLLVAAKEVEKVVDVVHEKVVENDAPITEAEIKPELKVQESAQIQLPKKPEKPLLLSKYSAIMDLDAELKRRNDEIFRVERERSNLEIELSECSGVFKQKVSLYTKNNVDYLQVSDNGVGMNQHIIDNYYTNIGCSYYSSREFSDLMVSFKSSFTPISRFGIGILSCFMVCDSMEVTTRRIRERFECDEALHVSIEGYESLFVISDSDKKDPGTDTILTLRPVHPWDRMDEDEFVQCIKGIVPNPAVQIEIETDKRSESYSSDYFDDLDLSPLLDYSWNNTKNIRKIDIDLTCEEYGFKGRGCIGILIKNDMPVEEIEILSKDVEIDGEIYTLSSSVKYKNNCITETSTSISVDEDGEIDTNTSWSERFKSKSSLSIHGIEVPYNLFPNYSNKMSKAVLNILFPFSFRLDIGVNSDLNLNSARDQIIYDEKWLTFEENLYQVICKRLKEQLSLSDWERLNEIIQKNGKNIFSRVANNIE